MYRHYFLLCSILFCATPAFAQEADCAIAKDALRAAQTIRKLTVKKEVPCIQQSKEEVLAFLRSSVMQRIPEKKLKSEALVYKLLGAIPHGYSYVDEIMKLYAEQAGGYYDPHAKRYVMASWLPALMQPTIAAHELTHALQDQYYNLEQFMDDKVLTGDAMLARAALVEGDATAVMNDFQLQGTPQSVAHLDSVEPIILQTVVGSYMTQSVAKSPALIKNMMLFPYTSGLRFVHFFLKKGGYESLQRLYMAPPTSTSEILHPERYPRAEPVLDRDIMLKAKGGMLVDYEDTLGEFFIASWLAGDDANKEAAVKAADGVIFDRVLLSRSEQLVWLTYWESARELREFSDAAAKRLPRGSRLTLSCSAEQLACEIRA